MPDEELLELAALSRSISEADRVRHTPPPGLFDRIAAEVGASPIADRPTRAFEAHDTPEAVINLTEAREARSPAASRHRNRQLLLASLAAACALIIGFAAFGGGDAQTFVAVATNNELPEAFDGAATATLTESDEWTLEIDFSDELPDGEPVELWLIKPDLSDMVSLGLIEPGDTQWEWPEGIEPTEYSLVDMSIEPEDGPPTHSGRSILRGELRSI